MRITLDACVLYPSVLRSLLIGVAKAGHFTPLWSDRILEEWRRAAERNGDGPVAAIEIALLRADWPKAIVPETRRDDLHLPDMDDVHVLETALASSADAILTANLKDFPTKILGRYGLLRFEPDAFLLEYALAEPESFTKILDQVVMRAAEDGVITPVKLLKKARLPRLAKHFSKVV